MRLTLIDNYDSFTWNLVHELGALGCDVSVFRNDRISVADVAARNEPIVLSPGPCTPAEAGICCALIATLGATTPILGVCLGHQAIGAVYGGTVVRAPTPMHGKVSKIHHAGRGLFRGINGPFAATRYHSLIVRRDDLPPDLDVTAESDDGLIMGLSHRVHPVHGVQFHPESILSEHGRTILQSFMDIAADWRQRQTAVAA